MTEELHNLHVNSNLLDIEKLQLFFSTDKGVAHVIRGVDIAMLPGEVLGLVGESGCGKSVTAKSIMKLHDPSRTSVTGSIRLNGIELLGMKEKEMQKVRGSEISMIFQDPMASLNPLLRVGHQVSDVLRRHRGMDGRQAQAEAIRQMERVGISQAGSRYRQYPHELSGGMLQRIMISAALACKPKLLIADEPTTALDVTIQAQILRLMKQLQHESDMAMLLITHDLGIIAGICDHVAVMYAGEVLEYGKVKDFYKNPLHPYTLGLLSTIPGLGSRGKQLVTIEGEPPDFSKELVGCPYAGRCSFCMEKCSQSKPVLADMGGGHTVACHYAGRLAQRRTDTL